MKRSADVVIVGGGIVGCAAAYFLSEAGAKVMIVERNGLGSGAKVGGSSSPPQAATERHQQDPAPRGSGTVQ